MTLQQLVILMVAVGEILIIRTTVESFRERDWFSVFMSVVVGTIAFFGGVSLLVSVSVLQVG